jgi:predicted NBD/HSP70 family sugar kinase
LGDYALTREAATALDDDAINPTNQEELLDLLFAKAKEGHAAAETIFLRAGRFLSVGLSNVVQLFDPPLIIVSGDRMRYDYFHADAVASETRRLTLSSTRRPCQIETHLWEDTVWARGAIVPALTALSNEMVGGLASART